MKPSYRNPFLRNIFVAATLSFTLGQAAHAAALTWSGGSGSWENGQQGGWSAVWSNTAPDTGTFNGAGGTVNLVGNITFGNAALAFSAGNYSLAATSPVVISLASNGNISLGNGVAAAIGSNVTVSRTNGFVVIGSTKASSTLDINSGGKLSNTTANTTFIRQATVNVNTGGTLENGSSIVVGDGPDGATFNIAGNVTVGNAGSNFVLGNGAVTSTVQVTITDGNLTFTDTGNNGGIRFGGSGTGNTTGTFNLDGGVVTVNKVYEAASGTVNSTFNFNGGTLKALKTNTTDFMAGLNTANVKSLGAKIDSAAFNLLISQNLLDGGGGGGLTKTGTGALTLSGTNTYTGTTEINGGTLTITSTAALPGWDTNGRHAVADGATLAVYNAVTDGNITTLLGTTNFAAGASIGLDTTTASRAYSVPISDTAQGALGLTKLGANTLTLNQANSYSGPTTVTNGVLTLQNASALGSTDGGTVVASTGRLELDGGITVSGEALNLSGAGGANFFNGSLNARTGVNQWAGGITIAANDTRLGAQAGASLEVSGTISSGTSAHLVTFRPADNTATVIVSGSNTYVGPTTLTGGLVTASSLNSVVGGSASSNFGAPTTATDGTISFGAAEGSGLRYVGTGETTDRVINLGGTTQGGRIDQSGSGLLKFTSAFTATGLGSKTLTLQGSTAGTGEIAAAVADNSGTNRTSLAKGGTGTWTLSGTNTYNGGTAVNAGTLKLDYGTGNDSSKLSDSAALTLGSATLDLTGGTHAEVVGSTSLSAGTVSKVRRSSGSAVLQMNGITRNAGASIDFETSGIATTDTLNDASGILGFWATVGGSDWAANSTNSADGSIAVYAGYTDLANDAVIADGSTSNVRINGNGAGGSMTLGSAITTVNSLMQSNPSQPTTLNPGDTETLRTNVIWLGESAKGLTVGASAGDGILMSAAAGGDLLLRNNSLIELLTINSNIQNNTSTSSLTKVGAGAVVLGGTNTYTGATNLVEGTLKAGSSGGFGGTSALVMGGNSTLDLNGFDGAFTNLTATSSNTITTSAEGSGVDTLTISALSATSAALFADNGPRKLAVSIAGNSGTPLSNPANTFSGGLTIGSTVRLTATPGTVGVPGAITSGPFGCGPITVNGGNVANQGAQIWFPASNRTLVNDVIVNGNVGNGGRAGTFRIGTNSAAVTGLVISGNIDANLADAYFGCDSTSDGSALLLSGQLTGASGFRFFQSANAFRWTATLNNATANANDYAGPTTINNSQTTLALGAADQIPNGSGKGNVAVNFGTLDLAGFSETINGLSGGSAAIVDNVSTGSTNTLTVGDGDATGTTFAGVIADTTGTLSLVKIGTGTQTLSGANAYEGTTTVDGGTLLVNGNQSLATGAVTVNSATLGGSGTVGGAVEISATGTIAPGTTVPGTLGVPSADLNPGGTLAIDLNDAAVQKADQLVVSGTLDLGGAKLDLNVTGTLAEASYVIATAASITSSFSPGNVTGLPAGYELEQSASEITLVKVASGFGSWIGGFDLALGDQDPTDDPDSDGIDNLTEFALNGDPSDSSDNGLSALVLQDTSAPAGNELTLVAAIRKGAVFSSSGTTQTATIDGIVYAIEGSTDLVFPGSAVSVAGAASNTAPAASGLPTLPGASEWEYQTFKLDASEGLPGKGFLRIKVTAAP